MFVNIAWLVRLDRMDKLCLKNVPKKNDLLTKFILTNFDKAKFCVAFVFSLIFFQKSFGPYLCET